MRIELEVWQLITLLLGFFGACAGAGKLLMTQMQRHLDLRFHAQEESARPITSRSSTDWTDWRNPPRLKRRMAAR